MSDGDCVEAGDAARPKVGRDDVFAEVELRAAGADGSSRIDQQGTALRRDQQRGITLAHVDRSYLQYSRMRSRSRWDKYENERSYKDGRRRAAHMASTSELG